MCAQAQNESLGLHILLSRKGPGGLAQLARAPALQAGGQRFESVILHSVCENADRRSQSAIIRNGLEIFDILTHKTVSKDFKLKTELYDSINSQFTAESMSYAACIIIVMCGIKGESKLGRLVDALALGGDEGRDKLR